MSYPIHPDAALFPLMTDAELAELVTDIKTNGLLHPIVTDHTGELLVDGRNREIACNKAGVEPRYERLAAEVDIFTYIVSTNLHRRHLTPGQHRDIVRQVIARNPDKSNREIAKIADVSHTHVNSLREQVESSFQLSTKTTGADGKSRPREGKFSDEKKAELKAQVADNPWMPGRELAEMLGVSHGTVQRLRREMQGRPPLEKSAKMRTAPAGFPTIAEQLQQRNQLPRFDDLSREELGMGSKEYGAQQAEGYPEGWTNDDVFRAKNGRIPLGTPAERANRETVRRCGRITGAMAELARALAEKPTPEAMAKLTPAERDDIDFHWDKLGREIRAGLSCLVDSFEAAEDDDLRQNAESVA